MSSINRFQTLLRGTPLSGRYWRMAAGKRSVLLIIFDRDDRIVERKTFDVKKHGSLYEAYRAASAAAKYWDKNSKMARDDREREQAQDMKVRAISIMESWNKDWVANGRRSESSPIPSIAKSK